MVDDTSGIEYFTFNDVQKILKKKTLIDKFCRYMTGQTMGLTDDGHTMIYSCDLFRFIDDINHKRKHRLVD